MGNIKIKDPDAKLDYPFDWRPKSNGNGDSDWLAPDEEIVSYVITADEGITIISDSQNNGIVTVWLSGGEMGKWYDVACKITTSAGRTDKRTVHIGAVER